MTATLTTPAVADATHAAMLCGRIVPGMSFDQKVWAITARIPTGCVTSYGRVAAVLGTRGARAVGAALGRNPHAPQVPCHRVVGHDGRLTGFAHGIDAKRQLLQQEGVPFVGDRVAASAIVEVSSAVGSVD